MSGPYVYTRVEHSLFTVGFFAPSGHWHTDSDHADREQAAARVSMLNGSRMLTACEQAAPALLAALARATEFLEANYNDSDMPDILPGCRAALARAIT